MINIDFKNVMKWSTGIGAAIGGVTGFFMIPAMLFKDVSSKDLGFYDKLINNNMVVGAIIWSGIGACASAIMMGIVPFAVIKSINYCRNNTQEYLPFTENSAVTINNEEEPLMAASPKTNPVMIS